MKLGFTGTRHGTTAAQLAALGSLLLGLDADDPVTEFAHGDCVGADDEAATLAAGNLKDPVIHVHPPTDETLRAFHPGGGCAMHIHEAKPYFARNRDIVDACDLLIACPLSETSHKGGTWQTIGYAARAGKPYIVIWPDGRIEFSLPNGGANG